MRSETVPHSSDESPSASPAPRGGAGRLARLRAVLRFDGLWWRKFAWLGCVYGPDWWKRLSPPMIALIIFVLVRRNRRGAVENQRRVLGPKAGLLAAYRAAYRMFATFSRCFTETMEFYGPRPGRFEIDTPAEQAVAEVLERGRGAILVTAHLGNWDVSARALSAFGQPVNLVMGREINETAQEYTRHMREQAGVRVILSHSSVFSAFNMIRALRRNELLAIQFDRGAMGPAAPAGAKAVPFFGAPALFQSGPFHLARLSGAPVLPAFTLRRGRRHYAIVVGKPRYVSREIPGDTERALAETVTLLEDTIRRHPDQWFQFEPFWPEPLAGASSSGGTVAGEAPTARPLRPAGAAAGK